MHKANRINIDKYLKIYDRLKGLHVIPRWDWNTKSLSKLDVLLKDNGVSYFLDDVGNVVLNCKSAGELQQRLERGEIFQVLQAHLDHPGAVVVNSVSRNKNLYSAEWLGGCSIPLEGRELLAYDSLSGHSSIVKVELDLRTSAGRFIYFYSRRRLKLGDTILHYKSGAKRKREKILVDWALDDLIGCAAIIYALSETSDAGTIGLLTLGEEVGGYGLEGFCKRYIYQLKRPPYFINIDATEEGEGDFVCGSGVWLRYEDRDAKYDESLVEVLLSRHKGLRRVSLTRGGTEAGSLSRSGLAAVSLAVPIRNLHNGSRHYCWTDESVFLGDVSKLCASLLSLLPAERYEIATRKKTHLMPVIKCTDYAAQIVKKVLRSKDYCDFLLNASDYWNRVNLKYNLPPVYLSSSEYEDFKARLELDKDIYASIDIKGLVKELLLHVRSHVSDKPSPIGSELQILTFLKANFNACNMNGSIALSLDKLQGEEARRVLAHELSHWMCDRLYKRSPHNNLIQLLLSEGSACFVSQKVCALDPEDALGLSEATYSYYESIEDDLKERFRRYMDGMFVHLCEGPKHSTLKPVQIHHPFRISRENPLNKYGYFLGYKFIKRCVEDSFSIEDVFTRHKDTMERLADFFGV